MTRPTIIPGRASVSLLRCFMGLIRGCDGGGNGRTSEDGNDGFMYGLNSLLLKDIAREQGGNEQHDKNEKGP